MASIQRRHSTKVCEETKTTADSVADLLSLEILSTVQLHQPTEKLFVVAIFFSRKLKAPAVVAASVSGERQQHFPHKRPPANGNWHQRQNERKPRIINCREFVSCIVKRGNRRWHTVPVSCSIRLLSSTFEGIA